MSLLDKIKVKPPAVVASSAAIVAAHAIGDVAEVVEAWATARISTANACEAFGKKCNSPSSQGEALLLAAIRRLYAEGYALRRPLERSAAGR